MSPTLIALVCAEMKLEPDTYYSSHVASQKLNIAWDTLHKLTIWGHIDCDLDGKVPAYKGWHIAARWIRRNGLASL